MKGKNTEELKKKPKNFKHQEQIGSEISIVTKKF